MEIGHYDFHDFNKRSTNTDVTPNDIYTDGAIVGMLGIHQPLLQRHDFHDSYFRMVFYYRVEEEKQSVLWLQNVTALGWSGGAKVLCILHHWGVQLILAYSWARPAILVQM